MGKWKMSIVYWQLNKGLRNQFLFERGFDNVYWNCIGRTAGKGNGQRGIQCFSKAGMRWEKAEAGGLWCHRHDWYLSGGVHWMRLWGPLCEYCGTDQCRRTRIPCFCLHCFWWDHQRFPNSAGGKRSDGILYGPQFWKFEIQVLLPLAEGYTGLCSGSYRWGKGIMHLLAAGVLSPCLQRGLCRHTAGLYSQRWFSDKGCRGLGRWFLCMEWSKAYCTLLSQLRHGAAVEGVLLCIQLYEWIYG